MDSLIGPYVDQSMVLGPGDEHLLPPDVRVPANSADPLTNTVSVTRAVGSGSIGERFDRRIGRCGDSARKWAGRLIRTPARRSIT